MLRCHCHEFGRRYHSSNPSQTHGHGNRVEITKQGEKFFFILLIVDMDAPISAARPLTRAQEMEQR